MEKIKIIAVTFGFAVLLVTGVIWAFSDRFNLKSYYSENTQSIVARLNNSGDYAGAQKLLIEKIKTNFSPEMRLLLATSYLDEGSVRERQAEASKKAQSILFGLEKAYYKSVYMYDLIGYSYEMIGEFDKALGYYNRSLIMDNKSVNTLYSIGHTYWFKGDLVKAKEYYSKAEAVINKTTDNSVVVKVYAAQGSMNADPKKSEGYFLKALSITDSKAFRAELYANLSQARYLQKDFTKAIEYAGSAIKIDPSNELGYLAYSKAALLNKDFLQKNAPTVEEYLVKSIFLAPGKAEPQYLMGKFDFVFGKPDLAIISYDTARKYIPNDISLNKYGRNALMSDVLFDEAVVYVSKNDPKYKSFLIEAFRYNPTKIAYTLDNSPDLRKKMVGVILNNPK